VLWLANIITLAPKQADFWLKLIATETPVQLKLSANSLKALPLKLES
jgi:hypothetical protein